MELGALGEGSVKADAGAYHELHKVRCKEIKNQNQQAICLDSFQSLFCPYVLEETKQCTSPYTQVCKPYVPHRIRWRPGW